MQWEYLGKQNIREGADGEKGFLYHILIWRTPVPGGWLIMSLNSRSNDPQPNTGFYPDPAHIWKGNAPPEADFLLRPANGTET